MPFTVEADSPHPPFEQLRRQILEQAQSGMLVAGAQLPTVRGLADELGIAPNTVARAYRELEAIGAIETRGRNGTFVSATGTATERLAKVAAREYADRISNLGIDPARGLEYVRAALGQ